MVIILNTEKIKINFFIWSIVLKFAHYRATMKQSYFWISNTNYFGQKNNWCLYVTNY